ncbi:hypothetical protein GCM10010329_35120 [Streptomyces spiroverticillatus]|uniref:DUF4350 domain-containing protein n=1 Tax=Streptomyces finlayi TaxID=67296 RepID=A0A919CAI3_9ACTN|nr:hypothetical protein GCM10010329_35120 [Streptomyces spiroverticillatus]GHC96231.1 hypothetical protein GCM10010334_36490 [Streptomyces finlayi]
MFVGVVLLSGIVLAALQSGSRHDALDPRSASPAGTRAVAELLKERGVSTRVVTSLTEATSTTGPDTTLLVTSPNLLTSSQQQRLHQATSSSGGRTLLAAPSRTTLSTLAPGVDVASQPAPVTALAPRCSLRAATTAGHADLGGLLYSASPSLSGSDACYPVDGHASLLRLTTPADGDTVLLGAPDFLQNEHLDQQGNASLALQLLGSRPNLTWYLPSLDDPTATGERGSSDDTTGGFLSQVPPGWLWGTAQLALAALLAALWRARRLGPLVTERLPVAIRASETTEGRARLYRRANARDRAASALRSATRTRLSSLLGVPTAHAHTPAALLPALSARLPHSARDFDSLLFGPTPSHDTGLVRLADELDALEREVRAS